MGPSVLDPKLPAKIAALMRASIAAAMMYRSNFVFGFFGGIGQTIGRVAPLWLVYQHTDAIRGWAPAEAMLVMSFFLILGAFQEGVLEPNLGEVVEAVRSGSLDLWLIKPIDAQVLVSMRKVDPTELMKGFAGVILGVASLTVLGAPSVLDVAVAAAMLALGMTAIYGLWMLAICTSFWWVSVDNLRYLLMASTDAGRWPITVFGGLARFVLTAVIPVALVTSFPAMALRGQWGVAILAQAAAIALVFVVASRMLWRRGLASYTSASS
jgi:ABC-2 type transport system permease protein